MMMFLVTISLRWHGDRGESRNVPDYLYDGCCRKDESFGLIFLHYYIEIDVGLVPFLPLIFKKLCLSVSFQPAVMDDA